MYYEKTSSGYIIRVRITPNSSKNAITGIFTDNNQKEFLKINLRAIPEKGKANQELIVFLSKLLHLNKSSFTIISGEIDRYKKLKIDTEVSLTLETTLATLGHSL